VKPTWCTFIQFRKNQGLLHVSSITCSSSWAATDAALGIYRAWYVSWLHQERSGTNHVEALNS
jgi:hypothetical protein